MGGDGTEGGGGCDCDVGRGGSRGMALGLLGLAFLGLIARRRRA
jgi:MYXO-CTERM domain-containing protein